MKQSYNMRFWSLREKGPFVSELSCRGSFIKVPMKRYFFPHNMKIQRLKYRISKFEFPSIKIVGFTSAQSWTILPSKRHVTSTRDDSLCVQVCLHLARHWEEIQRLRKYQVILNRIVSPIYREFLILRSGRCWKISNTQTDVTC